MLLSNCRVPIVHLTSIYYQVLGYPELLIAPIETIIGLAEKIRSLTQGTV